MSAVSHRLEKKGKKIDINTDTHNVIEAIKTKIFSNNSIYVI